jgi:hypothetical protein
MTQCRLMDDGLEPAAAYVEKLLFDGKDDTIAE